jgi:hypothetical protein
MISILDIIFNKLKDDPDYIGLSAPKDQIYESWVIMSELLDPNKSYDYKEVGKGFWIFEDRNDITYFVRLTYQPVKEPFYELKIGWFDKDGHQQYYKQTKDEIEIDSQRSDTIAKIYRDEVIPMFIKSEHSGEMHILPLKEDPARYKFFLRMAQKFPIPDTTLVENKYKSIIVKKNNFTPKSIEVDNPYK